MADHYVKLSDIKPSVVRDFIDNQDNLETYAEEADAEIVDLAFRNNVTDSDDIDVDSNGYLTNETMRRYWIAYLCMCVCRDNIGVNNKVSLNEIYRVNYEIYLKETAKLEKRITKEMITGDDDEMVDRIGVSRILRAG